MMDILIILFFIVAGTLLGVFGGVLMGLTEPGVAIAVLFGYFIGTGLGFVALVGRKRLRAQSMSIPGARRPQQTTQPRRPFSDRLAAFTAQPAEPTSQRESFASAMPFWKSASLRMRFRAPKPAALIRRYLQRIRDILRISR